MKKKIVSVLIMLIVSLLLIASVNPSGRLIRLEIKNRTHKPVNIVMLNSDNFYYLTVEPYQTSTFTIERAFYLHTTWACDKETTGTIEAESNLRLVFTSCYYLFSPNAGTPTIEKIHLNDAPIGISWKYQNNQKLPKFFLLFR
jgi:hypothetical protein